MQFASAFLPVIYPPLLVSLAPPAAIGLCASRALCLRIAYRICAVSESRGVTSAHDIVRLYVLSMPARDSNKTKPIAVRRARYMQVRSFVCACARPAGDDFPLSHFDGQ
jgi:hypothetical protein